MQDRKADRSMKTSCDARPDHTLGQTRPRRLSAGAVVARPVVLFRQCTAISSSRRRVSNPMAKAMLNARVTPSMIICLNQLPYARRNLVGTAIFRISYHLIPDRLSNTDSTARPCSVSTGASWCDRAPWHRSLPPSPNPFPSRHRRAVPVEPLYRAQCRPKAPGQNLNLDLPPQPPPRIKLPASR
jgi:hypothetical protein